MDNDTFSPFNWVSQDAKILSAQVRGGGTFKVNIQGPGGKLVTLNQKCNRHVKVRAVKQMLASQGGGDADKMKMKYNGREMDDAHNLGFYGISDSRNLITVSFGAQAN